VVVDAPASALAALSATVAATVRECGLGVVVDVMSAYQADVATVIALDAQTALGQLTDLPPGLFCRDLQAAGWTARNAVDYWFYWGRPDQMDADHNGVPCETVWPGAVRDAMPYA
jgi:hypothetical protein